jgi:hypothetical protein
MQPCFPTPISHTGDIVPDINHLARNSYGENRQLRDDRSQGLPQDGRGHKEDNQTSVDVKRVL